MINEKDGNPDPPTSPKGSAKGVKEEKKLRESASLTNIHKTKVGADMFRKLKMIGRGDVGSVYLVQHNETKKLYAMKILTKEEMLKRNKVKRVLTEREILATADHPFIVTLYWSFQGHDSLYFIMDYCAGGEFFRMLQKQPGKCLQEDHVRFYAAEVLLALEYLHMMGFIYRDLKPENILLHESGHIMLTDFDLSKAAATTVSPQVVKKMFGGKTDVAITVDSAATSFVGTAEYIAPEVIKGFGQSSSVDFWTFGILMYEMLFGTTPYRGKSQDDTFEHILDGELSFPENTHSPVGSSCKSLIKKLLEPDPKKRLGSQQGASEIKAHKFFEGKINFNLIRNMTPPIVPKISSPTDTSNFRNFESENKKLEEELSQESEQDIPKSKKKEDAFKDFTSIEKHSRIDHTNTEL